MSKGAETMSLLLEADVTEHMISLCRSLSDDSRRAIMLDMSLTHSLAFDSMKLMQFFAGVEALYPGLLSRTGSSSTAPMAAIPFAVPFPTSCGFWVPRP
jgi:hypothetical protein